MRLIDAIENIRKAYNIPVQTFIKDDISSHSYYRYLNGKNDIKLLVAVKLIKRTPITLSYFFKYMALINRETRAIDLLIEAFINRKTQLETYYQLYDIHTYHIDESILLKSYQKHKKQIQYEVSKMYNRLMILMVGYHLNKVSKETFFKNLKESHHACLYDMLKYQKALGILVMIHHFIPEEVNISYKKLLKACSQDALFEFGSWDVNELMSIMILNQPLNVYDKHIDTFEAHVKFIEKRLYGSLDIGFIQHVYQHQMILAYLKKDDHLKQYALRYHMTMKIFSQDDSYIKASQKIDIKALSLEALNRYDTDVT